METINTINTRNIVRFNIDNTISTHNTSHTISSEQINQPIILDQDNNEQEPIFL